MQEVALNYTYCHVNRTCYYSWKRRVFWQVSSQEFNYLPLFSYVTGKLSSISYYRRPIDYCPNLQSLQKSYATGINTPLLWLASRSNIYEKDCHAKWASLVNTDCVTFLVLGAIATSLGKCGGSVSQISIRWGKRSFWSSFTKWSLKGSFSFALCKTAILKVFSSIQNATAVYDKNIYIHVSLIIIMQHKTRATRLTKGGSERRVKFLQRLDME